MSIIEEKMSSDSGKERNGKLSPKSMYTSRIHQLCDESNYSEIKNLVPNLHSSALLEQQGFHKWTPLMITCVRAPLDVVKIIIQHAPEACNIVDKSHSLPLHFVACWRRDGEERNVMRALLNASRSVNKRDCDQIEVTNQWGQNPLHAAFDSQQTATLSMVKVLLGIDQDINTNNDLYRLQEIAQIHCSSEMSLKSKSYTINDASQNFNSRESVDCDERKQVIKLPPVETHDSGHLSNTRKATHSIQVALNTIDSKSRTPLHIACANGASEKTLQLLISLCPESCIIPNPQNELPLHLYYNFLKKSEGRGRSYNEICETLDLLITHLFQDEKLLQGTCTYDDNFQGKKLIPILPIHIACEYGLGFELISKLCEAYPKGVLKPYPDSDVFPLEKYMESGAHDKYVSALKKLEEISGIEAKLSDYDLLHEIITEFHKTSDLIFAYFPEVTPSGKSGLMLFRKDPVRMERLENIIRSEALDEGTRQLSTTSRLVWTWMCHFSNVNNPRDNYVSSVGRVIDNLESASLWKLTFVKTSHDKQGTFVKVGGPSGRTVVLEAENRAPHTTFYDLLQVCRTWQNNMLKYLSADDAMRYSCVCKHTYVTGVKCLNDEVKISDERWEKRNEFPEPWQQLELAIESCTHSVELSYRFSMWEVERNGFSNEGRDNTERLWGLPGLLIFKGNFDQPYCENEEPSIDALVKINEIRSQVDDMQVDVTLTFSVDPLETYELWYNLSPSVQYLSIQNLRMKQYLYCRNFDYQTPLHMFLSSPKSRATNTTRNPSTLAQQAAALLSTPVPPLNTSPLLIQSSSQRRKKSILSNDTCLLHVAIKANTALEVINEIIAADPSRLVETDKEGLTPLHGAFLFTNSYPSLSLIESLLLTTPGENAARLKDSSGRLPLHIAAECGANEKILGLLVQTYADGCYRKNKKNDLPLHLLVRSGKATTQTVELLIRPIMGNESICRVGGSRGFDLPLHIAARYTCSLEIFERLLRSYSDAAVRLCKRIGMDDEYALNMFEEGRYALEVDISGAESDDEKHKARRALDSFDQCSDLIFVYNPSIEKKTVRDAAVEQKAVTISMKSNGNSNITGSYEEANEDNFTSGLYRKDKSRISRLSCLIVKEARRVSEDHIVLGKKKARLCDTARLAWIWFATFEKVECGEDYFGIVQDILGKLNSLELKVLTSIKANGQYIIDVCASRAQQLLLSKLRFVGRYEWISPDFPLHKSGTCLVMGAKDYFLVEEYKNLKKMLEDSVSSGLDETDDEGTFAGCNSVGIPLERFLGFCKLLGISKRDAKRTLRQRHHHFANENASTDSSQDRISIGLRSVEEGLGLDEEQEDDDLEEFYIDGGLKVSASAFKDFCDYHGLDNKGIRNVVIKFMWHKPQFEREKQIREEMRIKDSDWPVVPILEDYDVDRMKENMKDQIFAKDIQEKNESMHDIFRFKYALVLMGADRDLAEICLHETPEILQIREYMTQVGCALQVLHNQGVIHGDLRLSNIVRFNGQLAFIDLDSSYHLVSSKKDDINGYYGEVSHKFSTGLLPPEMIEKIETSENYETLQKYEMYWKDISADAKDLKLLTPDDICTISSVLRSLLKSQNFKLSATREDDESELNLHATKPLSRRNNSNQKLGVPKNITLLEDSEQDWKDILSMALITISFEDLPLSLTTCTSVEEFAEVWSRMLENTEIWEKVQPHCCPQDGCAYIVKAFEKRKNEAQRSSKNAGFLFPFKLVKASEKIDIWAFGILIFQVCSKGFLFALDHNENIAEYNSYAQLHDWSKMSAEKKIREKVDDPLAQDLLLHMLVPEEERYANMDMVLSHPFFGSSSAIEAQRILEKHEELQMMYEETAVLTSMTDETYLKLECSSEKQCKIVFEENQVVVPTSIIILPYKLEVLDGKTLVAPRDPITISRIVNIGKHFLDINKATARLSFWLLLKKKMGGESSESFKLKMKDWLKATKEQPNENIAKEIVNEIGCGEHFIHVCSEMLEKDDATSNAKLYLSDPMKAARAAINRSTEALIQCYSKQTQYLYLVDEFNGTPAICSRVQQNFSNDDEEEVYPIEIDPFTRHFQDLFLPFLHITIMTATAFKGLSSLTKLLCLPASEGIPRCWRDGETFLVHNAANPSSIAEFAVLQSVLRKQEYQSQITEKIPGLAKSVTEGSTRTFGENRTQGTTSEWSQTTVEIGAEMAQLEIFFREYDPLRMFSSLRRVIVSNRDDLAIWTTEDVVTKLKDEVELASVEMKLRKLQNEIVKSKNLKDEVENLKFRASNLRRHQNDLVPRNDRYVTNSYRTNISTPTNHPTFSPKSSAVDKKKRTRISYPFFINPCQGKR